MSIYYMLDLLHVRIGNLNWCKCRHCKNETREIACLCCRETEVDAMLISSAKILLLLAIARLLGTRASLIYPVDEFFFLFLV